MKVQVHNKSKVYFNIEVEKVDNEFETTIYIYLLIDNKLEYYGYIDTKDHKFHTLRKLEFNDYLVFMDLSILMFRYEQGELIKHYKEQITL